MKVIIDFDKMDEGFFFWAPVMKEKKYVVESNGNVCKIIDTETGDDVSCYKQDGPGRKVCFDNQKDCEDWIQDNNVEEYFVPWKHIRAGAPKNPVIEVYEREILPQWTEGE